MSRWNGDKSRFNRERKQNIRRRKRTRELLEAARTAAAQSGGSKKSRSAPAPGQAVPQV